MILIIKLNIKNKYNNIFTPTATPHRNYYLSCKLTLPTPHPRVQGLLYLAQQDSFHIVTQLFFLCGMICSTNNPWGKNCDSAPIWLNHLQSRFFELDDRLTYYDLQEVYFHMIPYLCKGHVCFEMGSYFGEVPVPKIDSTKKRQKIPDLAKK